jgi:NAD(P)-dependent dehydrogenase (short-subunit alcohol dehydrogenase family)
LEYARQGIRVNAVCPGMVDTPMTQRGITPEFTAAILEFSPIGRFAQPMEIAAAVLWLSDESASFVTGQALAVDGGWTTQ